MGENALALRLPPKWVASLREQPETGMTYQIVTLVLNDGRRVERALYCGGEIDLTGLAGYWKPPFSVDDISAIEVTHDRTGPPVVIQKAVVGRLPLFLGIVGGLVYVMGFCFFAITAKTVFDGVFFVFFMGEPLSYLGAAISSEFSRLVLHHTNVYVDLGFLFIFGVIQYGVVGYFIGRLAVGPIKR